MEITEDQVEWAVIARLRDTLRDSPRHRHEVTLAFAAFSTLVCWVVQRMRCKGYSHQDEAAKRFYRRMQETRFTGFGSGDPLPVEGAPPATTVAEVLIAIRNGVAHGDGRSVRPLNRSNASPRPPVLTGFVIPWGDASLMLTHSMMVGFGTWIADEFIQDMTGMANPEEAARATNRANRDIKEARA